jgi:hypothetical protein
MSTSPALPKEIPSLAYAVIVARSPSPLFSQSLQSYTSFLILKSNIQKVMLFVNTFATITVHWP